MIKRKINTWLKDDIRVNPQAFFDFLERWFPEYVPDEALLASDDPLGMLKLIQQKSKRRFFLAGFHYYIYSNDIHHVKFVIDNLDDKEALLTHSVIELAAHLARGLREFNAKERGENPNAPERWMTVMVACRPNTAEVIQHGDTRSGNRWHGFHEIPIRKPCALGQALKGRYLYLVKGREFPGSHDRHLRFTLGDKPWTIEDRDQFFEGVCDAFDSSGQADQILSLCNNNVAAAMSAVLDVIRNRHFVKDEDLVTVAVPRPNNLFSQYARGAFTRTTVLRAIAYGNQGVASPVFPIEYSPVVNVLDSSHLPLGASTFKPRVIAMFMHKSTDSSRYILPVSLQDICNIGVRYLSLSYETAESVVDEMLEQRLIGNSRIVAKPSAVGPGCLLTLRPRAALLWRLLSEDSILLQCYRDDSELNQLLEWDGRHARFQNRSTQEMLIEDVAHELIWMVRQVWLQEVQEIDTIFANGMYGEFVYVVGSETVTERLLAGLENSRKRFYQRFSQLHHQVVESGIAELVELVAAKKAEWGASPRDSASEVG